MLVYGFKQNKKPRMSKYYTMPPLLSPERQSVTVSDLGTLSTFVYILFIHVCQYISLCAYMYGLASYVYMCGVSVCMFVCAYVWRTDVCMLLS